MKILILAPAPENISPSQRFRFEHYLSIEHNKDLTFTYKSFFSRKTWGILHLNNHYFQKTIGIAAGFARRFALLLKLHQYDWVYIHREAAPIGPPLFEWVIAKIWRKKIIYDFDDAIWVSTASVANPGVAFLKCSWKVAKICQYSFIVTAGNEYLASFARRYCKDVRVIPTVVNTREKHNKHKNQKDTPLTVGWTGTFSTLQYLTIVKSPIKKIIEKYNVEFLVIGNKDPAFTEFPYTFKEWNADREVEDLLKMNIGIMPLANTPFELGKCGFKAIQYMSLGIPAVVSPVGVNTSVVQNDVNGYWADSEEEWFNKLEKLILDESLRSEMGNLAKKHIDATYSVTATKKLFLGLFVK